MYISSLVWKLAKQPALTFTFGQPIQKSSCMITVSLVLREGRSHLRSDPRAVVILYLTLPTHISIHSTTSDSMLFPSYLPGSHSTCTL